MTTVNGLFTAGDGVGASGHKFSSGSHAEGRLAAKAMVKYVMDNKDFKPELADSVDDLVAEIYQPVKTYLEHKDYTTAIDVNPHYITPKMLQFRLQKIMDEYVAGVATYYNTNDNMLAVAEEKLGMLKEDALKMRAFWQIGIASGIQLGVLMAVVTHVMPYFESIGIERNTAGTVAMLIPLISLGARIPFGILSDIFKKRYVMALSIGLKGIGLIFFWLTGHAGAWAMILFLIIFGIGSGGMTPLRTPIIREYFGTKRFGTIFGISSVFMTAGMVITPPIVYVDVQSTEIQASHVTVMPLPSPSSTLVEPHWYFAIA